MLPLEVRIRRAPETADDFEVREAEPPRLTGGAILCRARWLALEPFVCAPRAGADRTDSPHAAPRAGDVVPALGVCEVVESRNDVFTVGQCVVVPCGLRQVFLSDGHDAAALHPGQSPAWTALGVLGPPGMAAYFGLLDLAGLRAGETVLVSAAAGIAGSVAGQVAALKGARAVGIEGSRERCDWVNRHARLSTCIDHRSERLNARLRQLAPEGFDIYFDSFGGELLETVLAGHHIARGGRVVLNCARAADPESALRRGGYAPGEVAILSLDRRSYEHRRAEFLKDAITWYGADRLVCHPDIVEGLRSAPAQLLRAMRGESFGQPLIKA